MRFATENAFRWPGRGLARAALFLAAAVAVPGSIESQEGADPAPEELTLSEAIERALEYAPAAVSARVAVDEASSGVLEARGDYLPSINLGSTFATSSNERFDQATGRLVSENYSAQATASYEVFSFGRRLATNRAARARLDAAIAGERNQDFAVALNTTQLFYDVAAAAELTEVARQRLERAQAQLEFAQVRLEVGTVTRSDVLRAELEVGNAELALVDAEATLRGSSLRLGRQVGVSGPVGVVADALPSMAPGLPPLAELVAFAEDQAPPVLSAQAQLRDRTAQKWSTLTRYAPSLRVSGGLDWFAFDFPPSDRSWNLRITASIPVFDGFSREASLSRNQAQERLAEARYRDAMIAARGDVEDAVSQIDAAEQRVVIAERGLGLAREDLRVQEERYQLGAATILELQTSQVALADAENAWVLERQNLGIAVAQLEAVLGRSVQEINE
jgi:outer membrane protein